MKEMVYPKEIIPYIVSPSADGSLHLSVADGENRVAVIGHPTDNAPIVMDIDLGKNSRLELYHIQSREENLSSRITVNQRRDSYMKLFVGMLGFKTAYNDIEVHLNEKGSEFRLDGLVLLKDTMRGTNKVVVTHHAPHCISNQDFKYILKNESRGSFDGLIKVDHGAICTEAYQNNRNLVVNAGARMETQPQLEIYCDDVKCSHGSATGQLDEQAFFYMRTRGIPLEEARAMLMDAFMSDIIERVDLLPLRELIISMTRSEDIS